MLLRKDEVRERQRLAYRLRQESKGIAIQPRGAGGYRTNKKTPAEIARASYARNVEVRRARGRARYQSRPIHGRISAALRRVLNGAKARRSTVEVLGYSMAQLCAHLERQFLPGMGWHNVDRWEIDHIIPVASFAFSTSDDPDFKSCWALTNLRPLWRDENRKKSKKRLTLI